MRWAISIFQIWLDLPWRSGQSLISLGSVTCPGACNQRSPFALTDCWLALAICQPPSPCMFCTSCSLGPGCILEKNVGWVLNLLLPVKDTWKEQKGEPFPACWPFNSVQLYTLCSKGCHLPPWESEQRKRAEIFLLTKQLRNTCIHSQKQLFPGEMLFVLSQKGWSRNWLAEYYP